VLLAAIQHVDWGTSRHCHSRDRGQRQSLLGDADLAGSAEEVEKRSRREDQDVGLPIRRETEIANDELEVWVPIRLEDGP
jgi:hypothetical protein